MQISARHLDKTTILDISGDIDLAHSSEVRRIILIEFREKHTPPGVAAKIVQKDTVQDGVQAVVALRVGALQPLKRAFDVSFGELHAVRPQLFGIGENGPGIEHIEKNCSALFWKHHGAAMKLLGYS